jgi:hypothetical protein
MVRKMPKVFALLEKMRGPILRGPRGGGYFLR